MDTTQVTLSIEKCFKQFDQSFNRIKYFSCIMDNLDASMLPNEWSIRGGKTVLSYAMKPPDTPDDRQNIVDGCKHFMQRYLVRDCIESFALCLDELFFVLLLHGKRVSANQTLHDALSDEEKERLRKFQDAGLFGKMDKLEHQCDLKLPKKQKRVITSLKDIRNCFAHSNGVVRADDGQKDGKNNRKFCWLTLSMFGVGIQSGVRYEIEVDKPLEEEVNGFLEIESHFKSFKKGDALFFSSADTYEIALSLHFAVAEYIKLVRDAA